MNKPQFTKLKKLLPTPALVPALASPLPLPPNDETLSHVRKAPANWQKKLKADN